MPQLDITTYSSQLFWLGIFFILLLLVSVRFMLPRLSLIQRQRWEKIEGTCAQAAELQHQAREIQHSFEQHLAQVRTQAHQKILQVSKSLEQSQEQAKQDINIRNKDQLHAFEQKISAQQKILETKIYSLAQSLTTDITYKMLRETVKLPTIEQSVHDILAQESERTL